MQIFDKYYTSESNDKNKSTNNSCADEDDVCTLYPSSIFDCDLSNFRSLYYWSQIFTAVL